MDNKPAFGLVTAIASISTTLLFFSFAWIYLPELPQNHWLYFLCVILFIIFENLFDLYLFMKPDQKHLLRSKIRAVFIITVLAYISISILIKPTLPVGLLPSISNIVPIIAILISAILVYSIRSPIYSRSYLYRLIELNSHLSLMETFNQEPQLVLSVYNSALSLKTRSIILIIVATFFEIISSFISPSPIYLIIAYLITIVSLLCIISLANIYLDEHRFFTFGKSTPLDFKRTRIKWSLLLIVISCLPVILFSHNNSVFPNALGDLFNLMSQLWNVPLPIPKLLQPVTPPNFETLNDSLTHNLPTKPNSLSIIFEFIKYGFFGIIVALIFYFIIKAILKSKPDPRQFFPTLLRLLREVIIKPFFLFITFCKNLVRLNFKKPKEASNQSAIPRISPRDYLKQFRKSLRRRSSMGKRYPGRESLILFFQYLDWAFKIGVQWTIADTPQDIAKHTLNYLATKSLENTKIDYKSLIFEITHLLEKDLFSRDEIGLIGLKKMKDDIGQLSSLELSL